MKLIVILLILPTMLFCSNISNFSFITYPQDGSVVFLNPASVGLFEGIVVTSGYGMIAKNIVDNSLSNSVFTFTYSGGKIFFGTAWHSFVVEDIYKENLYMLNFGMKLFNKKLFLGSNLKLYQWQYEFDEYYNEDVLAKKDVQVYNFDLATMMKLSENMNIGFTINNLLPQMLGQQLKYSLPQKYNLCFGYIYGITAFNFEVFSQRQKVNEQVFLQTGYRVALNQELWYSKNISFDTTIDIQRIENTTLFNLSLQTKLFSNKIAAKYTWSYPITNISGFIGDHYILLTFQPQAGVKKRKVVKHEQPQEIEEIVVVKPKKRRVKKVVEEQPAVEKQQYEIKISTPQVGLKEETLLTSATVEVVQPILKPSEEKIKKEIVYIKEQPEIKFPVAHKVKEGETLYSIAEKYYKNKKLWKKIYDANKDKIIKGVPIVGEILVIPEP